MMIYKTTLFAALALSLALPAAATPVKAEAKRPVVRIDQTTTTPATSTATPATVAIWLFGSA